MAWILGYLVLEGYQIGFQNIKKIVIKQLNESEDRQL